MKRLICQLVNCLVCCCLLLPGAGNAAAVAPAIDSFIGVPWGADLEQIDRVMGLQGFSEKTVLNMDNAVRYRTTVEGYPAEVVFYLWNGKFYSATASGICQVSGQADNPAVRACYSQLEALFVKRYGEPTRTNKWQGSQNAYWTTLVTSTGQKNELDLMLSMHLSENGLTEGSVQIRLTNRLLEKTLFVYDRSQPAVGFCPVIAPSNPRFTPMIPLAGIGGIPWGSPPTAIPGATQEETLAKVVRIYGAFLDVADLLGDVPRVKADWLVFDKDRGLQRGVLNFDGRHYGRLLQRLQDRFGNPQWDRDNLLYWNLADNLKIEIDVLPAFGKLHGILHISNPQFIDYERQLFQRKGS